MPKTTTTPNPPTLEDLQDKLDEEDLSEDIQDAMEDALDADTKQEFWAAVAKARKAAEALLQALPVKG